MSNVPNPAIRDPATGAGLTLGVMIIEFHGAVKTGGTVAAGSSAMSGGMLMQLPSPRQKAEARCQRFRLKCQPAFPVGIYSTG